MVDIHKNYHIYSQKEMLLHAMIGRVMSKWAALEMQLLLLAAWGLRMSPSEAAKLTSSFKTFALSLEFTQSVCATRLTDRAFLNSLVDLIRELSGDRNFIAHTQVTGHGIENDPAKADWALIEPKIGPAMKDYFAQAAQKRDPMDTAEAAEIAEDVQHAVSSVMGFLSALQSEEPWPGKYRTPIVPRRPRLAERRAGIEKASARQPQSSPRKP